MLSVWFNIKIIPQNDCPMAITSPYKIEYSSFIIMAILFNSMRIPDQLYRHITCACNNLINCSTNLNQQIRSSAYPSIVSIVFASNCLCVLTIGKTFDIGIAPIKVSFTFCLIFYIFCQFQLERLELLNKDIQFRLIVSSLVFMARLLCFHRKMIGN